MVTLAPLNVNQKRVAVRFSAQDPNQIYVPDFNGLALSVTPTGSLTFSNLRADPDPTKPVGCSFLVDITGVAQGTSVITGTGQQANFGAHFTTQCSVVINPDPAAPGLPDHWEIADGTNAP